MRTIYIMINRKGGVGKSTCCRLFAQYLRDRCGTELTIIDTDENQSVYNCAKLAAIPKPIFTRDGAPVPAALDAAKAVICEAVFEHDTDVLIDTAAGGTSDAIAALIAGTLLPQAGILGFKVQLHSPITCDALRECAASLSTLTAQLPGADFVLWLSPHAGTVTAEMLADTGVHATKLIVLPDFTTPIYVTLWKAVNGYDKSSPHCFCEYDLAGDPKSWPAVCGRKCNKLDCATVITVRDRCYDAIAQGLAA